jgi:hypothetical protein
MLIKAQNTTVGLTLFQRQRPLRLFALQLDRSRIYVGCYKQMK